MTSRSTESIQTQPPFGSVPILKLLIYTYVVVSPFFIFSVVFSRDFPSFWVIVILFLLIVVEVARGGGKVCYDRTMLYLALLFSAYVINTLAILFEEPLYTWAGRTPLDRAIGLDIRLMYCFLAFCIFMYVLFRVDEGVFRRLFQIQLMIGVLIALFGITQFLLYTVFGSTALTGIESTNETFQRKSTFAPLGVTKVFRSSSIFSEPSYFGFYLVPLIVKGVISWVKNYVIFSKVFDLSILVIFVVALTVNFSLTALLSLAIVLFFFSVKNLSKNPQMALWTIIICVLIASVVFFSPLGDAVASRLAKVFELADPSTVDRFVRAYAGLIVFLQHPWFGAGPGIFAFIYPKIGFLVERTLMHSPLNVWFTILTDVGLIGIVPFLLFLRRVLRMARGAFGKYPLVEICFWSVISYLVLLTTVDFWFLDIFWFELAGLVSISQID